LVTILSAANVHSIEMRFEFKQQKNLATARQTNGNGLEIAMIIQLKYQK